MHGECRRLEAKNEVWPIFFLMIVFFAFRGSKHFFLFVITAAGSVPCGGSENSPRTNL